MCIRDSVEADGAQGGKTLLGLFDHGDGDLVVGGPFHHLVVENEAVAVIKDAHPQAQFDRYAGLALADPFGVGLDQGEDLFFVGDDFTLQHATIDLIDLAQGVLDERLQLRSLSREMSHFYAAFCLGWTSLGAGFPGLRSTCEAGVQSRVDPDQRPGRVALACWYRVWRWLRMAMSSLR